MHNTDQIRDRVKELRRVRARDLRTSPRNWRSHPDDQRAALQGILAEVGYAGALIARELDDGSLELIDGHLRAETTPDMVVPVLVVDLDDAEAAKLLAVLDPIAAMAGGDTDKLRALLADVATNNEALRDLIEDLREKHDAFESDANANVDDPGELLEAEVLAKKWGTARGQVWELGAHRIMCGDSSSPGDFTRLMAGDRAALLSTDPPYCVDYTGMDRPIHDGKASGKDWSAVYREIDIVDLGQFLDGVFTAVLPHVDDAAGIYVWHAHLQQPVIAATFEKHGVLLHQVLVWVKPCATFGHSYYRWKHEPCAFGWKQGHRPTHGTGQLESVWEVDFEGKSRIVGNLHPTQKPLRLFEIPMEVHTNPGDVVVEPFSGSGSQLIAAEKLGRKCRAMEISPPFVAAAIERWSLATGKTPQKVHG